MFAPKHRLWVLVRTASLTEAVLTCTHNQCFEQKYKKNIIKTHLKIIIFTAVKYCCILHGRVCVMSDRSILRLNAYTAIFTAIIYPI